MGGVAAAGVARQSGQEKGRFVVVRTLAPSVAIHMYLSLKLNTPRPLPHKYASGGTHGCGGYRCIVAGRNDGVRRATAH